MEQCDYLPAETAERDRERERERERERGGGGGGVSLSVKNEQVGGKVIIYAQVQGGFCLSLFLFVVYNITAY